MKKFRRVFLIVADSFGVGAAPDAAAYGDAGADTLGAVTKSGFLSIPFLTSLGLFNIDGLKTGSPVPKPQACFGKARELSADKDTTSGHWELAGLVSQVKMPVFPDGFPEEIVAALEKATGREILCNKPYSGTEVIKDFGREQTERGALIVYTSADSVMQIAAHKDVVPLDELYEICQTARKIMTGKFAVGRIIARPFEGSWPNFSRTADRKDFSLEPHGEVLTDAVMAAGLKCVGVGKIGDIFCGRGLTESIHTVSNEDGMKKVRELAEKSFCGLVFVNLVDFDSKYGHRNDVDGYARALSVFDSDLKRLDGMLGEDDAVVVTADHGCDPSFPGTDHTREYVPVLVFGRGIKKGVNLGIRDGFCDIGATAARLLGVGLKSGKSFAEEIVL